VLEPFSIAVETGKNIVRELLDAGWQRRQEGEHQEPGNENTPPDQLPAIRLYPPGVDPKSEGAWFLEFLTVPESTAETGKTWTSLKLREGYFGLPSFRFLSVAAFESETIPDLGLRRACPEMMALANLLEHPTIGIATMSSPIGGKTLKRANKDLGRVLAVTALADLESSKSPSADCDLPESASSARLLIGWNRWQVRESDKTYESRPLLRLKTRSNNESARSPATPHHHKSPP